MRTYEIAVVEGDGIGRKVCQAALSVVKAVPDLEGAFAFKAYAAGAQEYQRSGAAIPDATFEGCRRAAAILHGAAGLPGVTYPDGTETGVEFGLQLRFRLDLYANVRPIKLRPGVVSRLRDRKPGDIDYVILRENTEGLYAARGQGVVLRDETAVDSLVMTRKGIARMQEVLAQARDRSMAVAVFTPSVEGARAWLARGASIVAVGVETGHFLRVLRDLNAAARAPG